MASNLRALASNLRTMASNLKWSHENRKCIFFFHGSFPCYKVLTRTSFSDPVIWRGRLPSAGGSRGLCPQRCGCERRTVSTRRSCLASAWCECHVHPTSRAGVARCCRLAQRTPRRCAHWTLLKCSFCKGHSVSTLCLSARSALLSVACLGFQ